jgi:hypothetical protein
LDVSFVDSFYLFVESIVGYPGRAGDNTVLRNSSFLRKVSEDRERWLGLDNVVSGDGGASDGDVTIMNPISDAREPIDCYFNFCWSSTRFFVKEIFGRWKNRFRFTMYPCDLTHKHFVRLVYALRTSKVLHNLFTVHKDDIVDFDAGTDEEWQGFFTTFARDACPSCVRAHRAHCPHNMRNRNATCPVSGAPSAQRDAIKEQLWDMLCEDDQAGVADATRNGEYLGGAF